ncbi:protein adenylyltransferase SelO family protein [Sphingosinicella xenopeptidilytica]|uniref:Protein adenylyltransferase SelO family protein n=1 Tax=Sphingosinicella xenopeptidilytica TaxID=364098 RepID=A0ABW3BZ76_SPHXN
MTGRYRPDPAILELGSDYYDPVRAADFPQTILRFRNQHHAETLGLGELSDEDWLRHFGRFAPLPGNLEQPLALRYHGHQFRTYNPEIGDGRGFLFAQMRDGEDRLLDLGTKGSGQTPYSRFGDGRLTLKGGMREVLATEMLEALGVYTSKSFSLIETGEALTRGDEPSPTRSSVLVRLSHSHIRYGTFQRLAYLKHLEAIPPLVDYCLRHFVGGAHDDPYAALMDHAVAGAARLAASWRAAGFVHGVLNTDNINVTAESFDYGPWRFVPRWDDGFTAAYFDQFGLYSFGRQAEALQWNVHQLAMALRTVAPAESLIPALKTYPERYEAALAERYLWRLGVKPLGTKADEALALAIEAALGASDIEPDRFWFDWRGGRRRGPSPADAVYESDAFAAFRTAVSAYEPAADISHSYWSDAEPCTMLIDEVEAIWAPIDAADDWGAFNAKIAAIRRMGEAYA